MCAFGVSITLRYSNCVIKDHTHIETNLGSKRPLSCHFSVQNYDITKKAILPITILKPKQMLTE